MVSISKLLLIRDGGSFDIYIYIIIFHAVCIQLTHSSYDGCEDVCTLYHYNNQIGSIKIFSQSSKETLVSWKYTASYIA